MPRCIRAEPVNAVLTNQEVAFAIFCESFFVKLLAFCPMSHKPIISKVLVPSGATLMTGRYEW